MKDNVNDKQEKLYELIGDEYISDGVCLSTVIYEGSLQGCMEAEHRHRGVYYNMHIEDAGESERKLNEFIEEFIIL